MNARQAVEENKLIVNQIIEKAHRVSKVRNITPTEALAYGLEVEMNYAKTDSEKAGINIRYDEAKKIMTTQNEKFQVVVSLKPSNVFDSNNQKKRYPEEYAKFKELGFDEAYRNTLRINFNAENAKDADKIYEKLKSGEYGNEYATYFGIRVRPNVCIFKNDEAVRFAL